MLYDISAAFVDLVQMFAYSHSSLPLGLSERFCSLIVKMLCFRNYLVLKKEDSFCNCRQTNTLDHLQDDVDEINGRVRGANQRGRHLLGK